MSLFYDSLLVGAAVVVVAFALVLTMAVITPINNAFQDANIDNSGKEVVAGWNSALPSSFDWILAVLFIGLPLIAFGLAYVNFIPRVFFFVFIGLLFVMALIGGVVSTMWGSVLTADIMSDAAATMPITNFIMTNYGVYFLITVFLISIGTYVKYGEGV